MIDWTASNPVFFDIETRSTADLRAVGGRVYAANPSTEILTLVALIDGVFYVWIPRKLFPSAYNPTIDPELVWPIARGPYKPGSVAVEVSSSPPAAIRAAANVGRVFVAHNCLGFDRFIWRNLIGPEPRWADTLPLARAAGQPGRLEQLSKRFTGRGKDEGNRILRKLMRPEKNGTFKVPGPGDLLAVARYNVDDVILLADMWRRFSELVTIEADVIEAHDKINNRGIRVDSGLAQTISNLSNAANNDVAATIKELTSGEMHAGNLRSGPQMHRWLRSKGVQIRDVDGKDTLRRQQVERCLEDPTLMLDDDSPVGASMDIDPVVFDVLRLRLAFLRITGAKVTAATNRVINHRLHDWAVYWGAHTGRWTSQGMQIHNLPRPKKGIDVAAMLEAFDGGGLTYDKIKSHVAGKKNLTADDVLSALIRPCLVASPGHRLSISDFAAIECRGIAWVAGEQSLLDAFTAGRDVYCEFASVLYGRPISKADDLERQVGKIVVLGCGYGMGVEKFRLFCALSGIDLTAAGVTAEQCIDTYRATYPKIAGTYAGAINGRPYRNGGVWSQYEAAAKAAVLSDATVSAGRCVFSTRAGCLVITLPSGRELIYPNCRIEDRIPGYCLAMNLPAREKPTLVYDGHRGEATLYGGKLAENIVQAICRDLLAGAMVRCESEGLPVVAHVHDELVCEVPEAEAETGLRRLSEIMSDPPRWAEGFPIAVEGFTAKRYVKSAPRGEWAAEASGGVIRKIHRK